MSSNNQNNNNESTKDNSNNTDTSKRISKLNPTHIAKAKLLRQKLREKKNKEEAEKTSNPISNDQSNIPSSPINTSKSSSNNNIVIIQQETEKIDPLQFIFSNPVENNHISTNYLQSEENKNDNIQLENVNDIIHQGNIEENKKEEIEKQVKIENVMVINEKNNIINIPPKIPSPPKESAKQFNLSKNKKKNDSDFSSSSSSDDDFDRREEQRLLNMKNAQENLFKKANFIPKNNFLAAKKKEPEITQEDILEKLFLDFDKTSELLELNEKKKQIMLKKMRRTLHRLSNLRININPVEEEKRKIIKKKIEEIQNLSGDNYNDKIKGNVEAILLNLKLPDYYFKDDEDIEIISDKDQKNDLGIKPVLDIDFISFMRQ